MVSKFGYYQQCHSQFIKKNFSLNSSFFNFKQIAVANKKRCIFQMKLHWVKKNFFFYFTCKIIIPLKLKKNSTAQVFIFRSTLHLFCENQCVKNTCLLKSDSFVQRFFLNVYEWHPLLKYRGILILMCYFNAYLVRLVSLRFG